MRLFGGNNIFKLKSDIDDGLKSFVDLNSANSAEDVEKVKEGASVIKTRLKFTRQKFKAILAGATAQKQLMTETDSFRGQLARLDIPVQASKYRLDQRETQYHNSIQAAKDKYTIEAGKTNTTTKKTTKKTSKKKAAL